MTDVVFYKQKDIVYMVECSGHTGYADSGSDIVCSALSSMVQSCALGLKQVLGLNVKIERVDKKGYFKLELPKNLSDNDLNKSQILLKTLELSIKDLLQGYSKFIKLEERDYVY
ncbi:MAG: ribosomal-processing cysteine protease Prp [Clostridia bacterium]|nr:ribosomal-processing cysteine protease Prp [Clostridia bacterium]